MQDSKHHIELEDAVIKTLTYFDIFKYPLRVTEIITFLGKEASKEEVSSTITKLVNAGRIFQSDEMYSLQFQTEIFERRLSGNALAEKLLPAVKRQADLIYKFPFVRAVMASGSFSKNYMDEKSDFDFFIICARKRLWISRMLLVLYKKVFLANSHQQFCINYFVDETHLEIDEKNIFSATELATVFPLTGTSVYDRLMAVNQHWLNKLFPNFKKRSKLFAESRSRFAKSTLEIILDNLFADHLNRLFKNITIKRWRKLYAESYDVAAFNLAFESTEHVSKNHPRNFQVKVLAEYYERVRETNRKVKAL